MTILLVEDSRPLARALAEILRKHNYTVETVFDGNDAIDYIRSSLYDCVLLDVMLPGRDGISVLREARAAGVKTPVIMLTAKSEIADKVEGLDSGANDYITKPFNTEELLARIRVATRAEAQDSALLRCGNTTLDRAACLLSADSESFRLTGKEYQIMEMLMLHPAMPVSADQIIQHVWGFDSNAEANIVWVYISYLRKKLTALHSDLAIRAVRNSGYILEVTA